MYEEEIWNDFHIVNSRPVSIHSLRCCQFNAKCKSIDFSQIRQPSPSKLRKGVVINISNVFSNIRRAVVQTHFKRNVAGACNVGFII